MARSMQIQNRFKPNRNEWDRYRTQSCSLNQMRNTRQAVERKRRETNFVTFLDPYYIIPHGIVSHPLCVPFVYPFQGLHIAEKQRPLTTKIYLLFFPFHFRVFVHLSQRYILCVISFYFSPRYDCTKSILTAMLHYFVSLSLVFVFVFVCI